MATFPSESGVRERLALLAARGPKDVDDWSYDSRFDRWFRYERGGAVRRTDVKQEGVASLAIILEKWGIGRAEALAMIGYPEKP